METLDEWKELVEGLKEHWRILWRDRIDDRVRAEGIARAYAWIVYYPDRFINV